MANRSAYVGKSLTLFSLALLSQLNVPASADTFSVPYGIPFSGYLTDATGVASTAKSIDAIFQFQVGGVTKWCAQYSNISLSSGAFFLVLGSTGSSGSALNNPASSCTAGGSIVISPSLLAATSSSNVAMVVKVFSATSNTYEELKTTANTGFIIASAPYAMNADSLGGTNAAQYAKFETDGSLKSMDGSTTLMNSSGVWMAGSSGGGSVTNIATGTGLSGGPITATGTISLANTAVSAGSYVRADITVDAQGRLTSAANGTSVPLASAVSGTLPIANGGTNSTATPTAGGVVYGTGTAMTTTAAGTSGYMLASGAAGAPTWTNTPSLSTLALSSTSGLTVGTTTLVANAGRIGVGTASPGATFEVKHTMPTGTISGGTAITGSGTNFLTAFHVGDGIAANYLAHTITAITDDTHLTIDSAFSDLGASSVSRVGALFNSGNVGIGTTLPTAPLEIGTSNTMWVNARRYRSGGDSGFINYPFNFSMVASGAILASEFNATSDRRVKKDIQDVDSEKTMEFIKKARPVHFKWKETGVDSFGFIAQDLLQLDFPELITPMPEAKNKYLTEGLDSSGVQNPKGIKFTVNYNEITSILTKGLQVLYGHFEKLMAQATKQDQAIAELKQENAQLKAYICAKDPQASFCK